MKLANVSIQRPVLATMMIVSLLVLGLFALNRLNVDLYPDVDVPFVVITTVLPGAGPEQIETDVTKPIEDAVNPIEGVKHIESRSQENVSIVIIEFRLEVDGKLAAQDVREKLAAIRNELPDDIEEPVIQRYDPASQPIMTLSVSGALSEKELTTFTKDVVKKRLENVLGVGSVTLVGGSEREIQVNVDVNRLKAYSLSIQDVALSVGINNMEIPGGNLEQGSRQLLLRTEGKLKSIDEFKNIIIIENNGDVVRLGEIAEIVDGVKTKTSIARYNGRPSVGLDIMKQSGANTVQVADEINKEITKLNKELPDGIQLAVATDGSVYIRDSVNDVLFDLLYGGLLAVIVVYLFLANIRSTIISAIALPTSVIATFFFMYMMNFTLNMMSLLALSLAVGLLIDDAIVVIENIYRHLDEGESPFEAAKKGTAEIGLAVLATTFTIVAVFVPVAFMPGIIGRFFYEFGLTVSIAVLISLFVAFTLTPMLSSRWLKAEDEHLRLTKNPINNFLYYFNNAFNALNGYYRRLLGWSLRHRMIVLFGSIGVFFLSMFMAGLLGSEFFPNADRSEFFINVSAPAGSSLEKTDEICRSIEDYLKEQPEVANILTSIGGDNIAPSEAKINVKLVKRHNRTMSDKQLIDLTREAIADLHPGAEYDFRVESGPGGNEKPVTLSIRGQKLKELEPIADQVKKMLTETKGAVDVSSSLEASKPELRIRIDRNKAADLGVNVYSIASEVRSMVDGYEATKFQEGDEQYDVRVRLNKNYRTSADDIRNLLVKSSKKGAYGETITLRLGDIAEVIEGVGPTIIYRYNRQQEIRVDANLSGALLGDVLGAVMKETATVNLPSGTSINVIGEGEMQEESFGNILLSLALAIIFVYIVLAMQFESFVYPMSIMLALPMSIIGAILFLLLFGGSLSVMALIGIIMLMGLVTKNAILLIDYTNVQRSLGLSRTDALLKAGPTRLRPILMTTLAMIFGMVPVAVGLGEGSEFRSPMGQAVIGGLITSTMLTLVVVPVVYTLLDDISFAKMRGIFRRKKKTTQE